MSVQETTNPWVFDLAGMASLNILCYLFSLNKLQHEIGAFLMYPYISKHVLLVGW